MDMKLSTYLSEHDLSASDFAARMGVPVSTITRWAKGERTPGIDMAHRICEATSGAVTASDFLLSREEAA